MRISQYVYFNVSSETLSAADVTGRLLFEPDEFSVMGARDPLRVLPRQHHWKVMALPENRPVGEQIEEIVARLAPVADRISELVGGGEVAATLWVVRHFDDEDGEEDAGTPPELAAQGFEKLGGQHHLLGWELNRAVLDFLQTTGAVLCVDECG